jgi:LDH2 family malate/lactate/ureidoglycolate dehydrogenase
MTGAFRVSRGELQSLASSALKAVGVPEPDADAAAAILVTADLQGIDTHGTSRLAAYVTRVRDGVFNAKPDIVVESQSPAVAVIDGDRGLGPVVGSRALDLAVRLAAQNGVAYVGCRNSQHLGALAPYALRATRHGMVCFLGTNAFPSMAPWGGREVKVGNNPLGVGAPRRDAPAFILDIAMSVAARGKIRKAGAKGERIPDGWALDAEGNPTTDPAKALDGYVLPIGGHKGYGLALAVDILAGVLSGGAVSTEVQSLFKQKDKPQQVSFFFLAIDPAKTIGLDTYFERMETLCGLIKDTEPSSVGDPVLLPGEIEARELEIRSRDGIPMEAELLDSIRSLARGEAPSSVPKA